MKPNLGSFCILSFILSSNKVGSLATPMKTHGYVATAKGFHKMLDRPSHESADTNTIQTT